MYKLLKNFVDKYPRPRIGSDSLQLVYQVRFDVNVYGSVPGERPATLFVAAETADQVRILHLIVKIPDESAPSQMRRCNICNAFLLHHAGRGIDHRYFPGDAASPEDILDVLVIPLLGNKREKGRIGNGSRRFTLDRFGYVLPGIAVVHQSLVLHIVILLQDRECCFIQGNIDRYGMPLFGLAWDVTDAFAIAF